MIWNKAAECADREALEQIQLKKLKGTVARMYQNVEPYRAKMQEK